MTLNLATFLAELYELDPTLKTHEAELLPIIETLMKSDPAVSPDQTFINMLRVQLRERSVSLSHSPSMSLFQKLVYAFGGAITAAVVALVIVFRPVGQPSGLNNHQESRKPLFPPMIEEEGKKAFGPLTNVQPATPGHEVALERTQSVGAGGGMQTAPSPSSNRAAVGAPSMDAKMIAPYPLTNYTYVYNGTLPALSESVSVFKRDTSMTSFPFNALAGSFSLGSVNLSSFKGLNVDSMNFTQNVPFGYQIYVSLRDGSVGINQFWEQWPQSKCQTDACFESERLKSGDVLSDDAVIAIAKTFAKDHGIDLSRYGDPLVDSSSTNMVLPMGGMEAASMPAFLSDSKRVVFPQLVDGKPTYDQSGMQTGISMNVNLKHKRVSDVWGLSMQTYKKSSYTGVTDPARITKFISQVGSMYGGDGADVPNVTITLGEPTMGLVTYYRYVKNTNEELLVPSLLFPVEKAEGDQALYRTRVVVPLAQDLLDEQFAQPVPMPLDTSVSPPPNVKAE